MHNSQMGNPFAAFPMINTNNVVYQSGLTKLEYFTALAMMALIQRGNILDDIPKYAYEAAQKTLNYLNEKK